MEKDINELKELGQRVEKSVEIYTIMVADLMVGKGKAMSVVTEGSTSKGKSTESTEETNEKEDEEGEVIPPKAG